MLNVAGVDYQSFYLKQEYLAGAERLVYPGAVNLLLSLTRMYFQWRPARVTI